MRTPLNAVEAGASAIAVSIHAGDRKNAASDTA